MKTIDAIEHFGSGVALTAALGISSSGAISQWKEYPPDARQLQIERVTLGTLKAEPGCMDRMLWMHQPVKAAA